MSRLKQIEEAAAEAYPYDTEGTQQAFVSGAKWADDFRGTQVRAQITGDCEEKLALALAEMEYFIERCETADASKRIASKKTYARFKAAHKRITGR